MLIRQIQIEDAAAFAMLIHDVEKESEFMLYGPYERKVSPEIQEKMIRSLTKGENSNIFVAENHGELVGYLIAIGGTAKRAIHSANLVIGIREKFRGQGIGTLLFEHLEIWARNQKLHRLGLTVMSTNRAGQALYKKMGFELEGTKKHSLYVNGEFIDEYCLCKIF
jgi:RimJ/RimL family protein N-acetyltransferase